MGLCNILNSLTSGGSFFGYIPCVVRPHELLGAAMFVKIFLTGLYAHCFIHLNSHNIEVAPVWLT